MRCVCMLSPYMHVYDLSTFECVHIAYKCMYHLFELQCLNVRDI
uniref:Uncharacterized protein n=1 Tax=Anguilla anguilla TaxID=7936 RepID=A0A0E9TYX3_ANGAN